MKLKTLHLLLFFLLLTYFSKANVRQNHLDTLYAPKLKPYGRYLFNENNQLEMISSAVHFGIKFKGESCSIYASLKDKQAHNYIQYEIDGVYQHRIRINGNLKEPIIIKADGNGEHSLWIYKATEAHTGAIQISKIVADDVKSIAVLKAPLIEFIGNSITCGAASDFSLFPCGTGEYHDQHNAYMAYGPRVARKLGMNYLLSSVSGIGIYRTWNMDGPSMPQVYEHVDFQPGSPHKWDFKKYSPKIVSIALGTNDLSTGDGKTNRKPFDETIFIERYVDFIRLVKSRYPKAQIALLSSPMIKDAQKELLEKSLQIIKVKIDALYQKDKKVKTFFFPAMEPRGCSGHPSVDDHSILADQLLPFYQSLLK